MPYPHDLRCPTNINHPEYVGYCQRCSTKRYFADLQFQFDFRGNALANLQILVCPECYDTPNEQLRPIITGPDGLPPKPRAAPPFYVGANTSVAPATNNVTLAQLIPMQDAGDEVVNTTPDITTMPFVLDQSHLDSQDEIR